MSLEAWSLIWELHLPACHSLKEKRSRLKSFLERWSKNQHLAISESGLQDDHQKSEVDMLFLGPAKFMEQLIQKMEDDLENNDIQVIRIQKSPL